MAFCLSHTSSETNEMLTGHCYSLGLFDSHALFTDILNNPTEFLNGTIPPNITGAIKSCVFDLHESTRDAGVCTITTGPAVDSFLW